MVLPEQSLLVGVHFGGNGSVLLATPGISCVITVEYGSDQFQAFIGTECPLFPALSSLVTVRLGYDDQAMDPDGDRRSVAVGRIHDLHLSGLEEYSIGLMMIMMMI
jgi:hypothetical protein